MTKRFALNKLLHGCDNLTSTETMVTQVHDVLEQDMADVVGIGGYILSKDGLKDLFYGNCVLTDESQKQALFAAKVDTPLPCTTSLNDPNSNGFPTITINK